MSTDRPKTPGAMVPINCRQRLAAEGKPYPRSSCYSCGQLSPKWRECDALIDAAPDEQTPAVGDHSARCMSCDRATVEQCDDAGCGYLGAGNGAPAVGGEPVTLALLHLGDFDDGEYEDLDIEVRTTAAEALQQHLVTGREPVTIELIDRAHVSPLLDRIAELEAQLAKANDWSHLKPDMDPAKP